MLNHPNPIFLITNDKYRALGAVEVTGGRFIGRDTAGRILFDRKDYDGALTAVKKHGRAVATGYYGVAVTGERGAPHPCAPCNMRRKMADDADRAARRAAGCPHGVEGWCQRCSDAERDARREREAAAPVTVGECACSAARNVAPARRLIARRVPEVGSAVYDRDTGEKVSPPGAAWWPSLRLAREELRKLEAAATPAAQVDALARAVAVMDFTSGPLIVRGQEFDIPADAGGLAAREAFADAILSREGWHRSDEWAGQWFGAGIRTCNLVAAPPAPFVSGWGAFAGGAR